MKGSLCKRCRKKCIPVYLGRIEIFGMVIKKGKPLHVDWCTEFKGKR